MKILPKLTNAEYDLLMNILKCHFEIKSRARRANALVDKIIRKVIRK